MDIDSLLMSPQTMITSGDQGALSKMATNISMHRYMLME